MAIVHRIAGVSFAVFIFLYLFCTVAAWFNWSERSNAARVFLTDFYDPGDYTDVGQRWMRRGYLAICGIVLSMIIWAGTSAP